MIAKPKLARENLEISKVGNKIRQGALGAPFAHPSRLPRGIAEEENLPPFVDQCTPWLVRPEYEKLEYSGHTNPTNENDTGSALAKVLMRRPLCARCPPQRQ